MSTAVSRAGRREWIGLAVLALPCLLYSMDLTVLNLAVPHLAADLAPSASELLWIVDIYGFVIAGSLITMGTLGDRIGRRRLLLIGATAFGAASVLAAFSTSAPMLIATRALLGIAGATLAPSTLSLIHAMFADERQRMVAIGVWATSFSAGGAIGPLLGGLMLQQFWWGSVFLLGVPVMALLLLLGPRLLPEVVAPGAGRLDLVSAALSLGAVLGAIYGLKQIAKAGPGWASALAIAAGVALAAVFVARQRRLADPLVDLRLFRSPAFSAALATNTLGIFVVFGIYVFIAQYLQLVLGLTPLQAGVWTLPSAGGFVAGSMLAPALVRRARPGAVIAGGLVLASAGLVAVAQVGGLAGIAIGSVIFSVGLAPVPTLATALIVGSAPPERAGAASGMAETSSELGGALGIALLGSLGTAIYRANVGGAPGEADSLAAVVALAAKFPDERAVAMVDDARGAFVHAFELTAIVGAAILLATSVVAAVLLRGRPSGEANGPACAQDAAALGVMCNDVAQDGFVAGRCA
jgi:DHA2 family multidrug resistance protein-like MFS transporter